MTAQKSESVQWLGLFRRILVSLTLLMSVLLMLLWIGYQFLPIRQLQWSGLTAGTQQIRLTQLSLQVGEGEQWWDLQLQQLDVDWRHWPLPRVKVQRFALTPVVGTSLQLADAVTIPAEATTSSSEFQLPLWPELRIPGWLPQQLIISELSVQVPCQTTQRHWCELQGSLQSAAVGSNRQMDLQIQGDGQLVKLQFEFVADAEKLKALHINQLQVQLDVQALAAAGWIPGLPVGLVPAAIQLQLVGHWHANELQLALVQPSKIAFSYQSPAEQGLGLSIPSAQIHLRSGQLQCPQAMWQQCLLKVDASAKLEQLKYPLLKVSDWQWQGQTDGRLMDLQLSGIIQNPQSLKISYQAGLSASALQLRWQLADLFLLAGNPLQITRLWPDLLELQRGKISANGQLQIQWPGGKLTGLQLHAQLNELFGIYDRTAFGGLTAQLELEGDPRSFRLKLPALSLQQLNHGFQAGPAQLSAEYRADWSAPTEGDVRLGPTQLAIFGGQLALADTQFNLQQQAIEFRMAVHQIQLAELLKQHPSSRMLGNGVLSGTIPLRYQRVSSTSAKHSLAQWQVFGGSLQAEAPGGRLQYQYQPVPGQKASGMDLAFEALSDFRYQTLATTVELQPDGKVLLQVKLHGFNPKLQQGRPVHFNINVEEDLPALLTSLQLSSQISDKVRQRIQQKIQQSTQQKPAVEKLQ